MAVLDQVAAAAAVELDVRTAHTPPLRWTPDDDRGASGDAAPGGGPGLGGRLRRAFLGWLRPELTITTAFGTVHRAPYGPAGASSWPLVPLALAAVLLLVVVLAFVGLFSLVRGR